MRLRVGVFGELQLAARVHGSDSSSDVSAHAGAHALTNGSTVAEPDSCAFGKPHGCANAQPNGSADVKPHWRAHQRTIRFADAVAHGGADSSTLTGAHASTHALPGRKVCCAPRWVCRMQAGEHLTARM